MHIVNRGRAPDDQGDFSLDLPAAVDPELSHVAAPLPVPKPEPEWRDGTLTDAVWGGGELAAGSRIVGGSGLFGEDARGGRRDAGGERWDSGCV